MAKRILVFSLLFISILHFCRCTKTEAPAVTYRGIVVYNICGNIVVQSVGPELIGENNWTDSNNPVKPVYNHVFKVANPCDFGMRSQGDTINFTIVSAKPQQCPQCLLYVATPATSYPIRVAR